MNVDEIFMWKYVCALQVVQNISARRVSTAVLRGSTGVNPLNHWVTVLSLDMTMHG